MWCAPIFLPTNTKTTYGALSSTVSSQKRQWQRIKYTLFSPRLQSDWKDVDSRCGRDVYRQEPPLSINSGNFYRTVVFAGSISQCVNHVWSMHFFNRELRRAEKSVSSFSSILLTSWGDAFSSSSMRPRGKLHTAMKCLLFPTAFRQSSFDTSNGDMNIPPNRRWGSAYR